MSTLSLEEKIDLYRSIFRGREDIYARRWTQWEKGGYAPAYSFDRQEFNTHRANGWSLKDFPNKQKNRLTERVTHDHLAWREVVGIYPLLTDNTSYFIAADFDKSSWKEDTKKLYDTCVAYNLPTYIEISRSGNGAHVRIFFEERYDAFHSRSIMFELLREAFEISIFEKEISFDRLFPNQHAHSGEWFGNLIALPLQWEKVKGWTSVFVDPETFEPYQDQRDLLSRIEFVSLEKLYTLYDQLCASTSGQTSQITTKKQWMSKNSYTLEISLSHVISLKREQLTPSITSFLKDELNIFNTEYAQKKRMKLSVHKIEKYFKLITEQADGYVVIPRGFLPNLISYCEENEIKHKIQNQKTQCEQIDFQESITLHPYQIAPVQACLSHDQWVLVAPPWSGKTVMALRMIAHRRQPTLIIVHRKQLLEQRKERVTQFLWIPTDKIWQIWWGKKKAGEKITIAMIQSLGKQDDDFCKSFGMIIVDECHHIPAKSFRATITKFNSYYLYGLTATPMRKHNDEKLIYYHIGEILATVTKDQQVEANNEIQLIPSPFSLAFDSKKDDYNILTKALVFNDERNNLIAEYVEQEIKSWRTVLILTERKEHIDLLSIYLRKIWEIITLSWSDSKSLRKTKEQQLKQGHYQIVIATWQYVGEWRDWPDFDSLFLVYPFSFEGKLIQYIGRIERGEFNNRTIYDIRDQKIPYLEAQFKKRKKYYQKLEKKGIYRIINEHKGLF